MATGGSKGAVVAAIAGNTTVMLAKFGGFALTGSGALLSEGIHTLADVLNQILLYVGIRQSVRPADRSHPYGYGAERYVWALMSAVGIFFLGCGVTLYHGITHLLHPAPLQNLGLAVGILVFSFVIEGLVLWIAYRHLRRAAAGKPFLRYLRREADPTAVAVLLEDLVACAGVIVALVAIALARITGQLFWDAVGSIAIGLMMGGVAIFLIMRNRDGLVGRAIPQEEHERIREVLSRYPSVEKIVRLRSRVLDPDTYRVQADVEFDGHSYARRLEPRLAQAYEEIESYEDFCRFAAEYADAVVEMLGDDIDTMEADVRARVPKAVHVDIETE